MFYRHPAWGVVIPQNRSAAPVDTTRPSVTINKGASQSDPTSAGPILFDIVFSEPVIGFTNTDITVSFSGTGTPAVSLSGSGATYTASVSGMGTAGNVTASIAANVCTDAALNLNFASTSTDNVVAWTVASGYVGPVDLVASPTNFWGVRAMSLAKITDGNHIMGLIHSDLYSNEGDFFPISNGMVDVSAINTFASGHSPLRIWFIRRQIMTHFNWENDAGETGNPIFSTTGGPGGVFPAWLPNGDTFQPSTGAFAVTQPFTVVCVCKRTGDDGAASQILFNPGPGHIIGFPASDRNPYATMGGLVLNSTGITTDAFHVFIWVINGASSKIYVDGVDNTSTNTLDGTAFAASAATIEHGNHIIGAICEVGLWPIAFNSTQVAQMTANCRSAANGYNF